MGILPPRSGFLTPPAWKVSAMFSRSPAWLGQTGISWAASPQASNGNIYVWRVTPQMEVTAFVYATVGKYMVAGDDGTIWLIDDPDSSSSLRFWKLAMDGTLTLHGTFAYPAGVTPLSFTIGTDGFLYIGGTNFTPTPNACMVTKVNPADLSQVSSVTVPNTSCDGIGSILTGPDGNIYLLTYSFSVDPVIFKVSQSLAVLQTITLTNGFGANLIFVAGTVGQDGAIYCPLSDFASNNSGYAKVA